MNILQINLNAPEESQIKGYRNFDYKTYYIFVIEGNTIELLQLKGKVGELIKDSDLPTRLKDRFKSSDIKTYMKPLKK